MSKFPPSPERYVFALKEPDQERARDKTRDVRVPCNAARSAARKQGVNNWSTNQNPKTIMAGISTVLTKNPKSYERHDPCPRIEEQVGPQYAETTPLAPIMGAAEDGFASAWA